MPDNILQGEFILEKTTPVNTPDVNAEKINSIQPEKTNNFLTKGFRHSPHFYSSLWRYPGGMSFEDQETNEEIILLIRADFITNVPWILSSIFLAPVPLLVAIVFPIFFPFLHVSGTAQLLIVLFYYLILFGFVLVRFSLWYFRVALVTNIRIVDVDIEGILYKNVAETKLDLIQDVSYTQIGAVRSVFNYGDILVQTAGSLPNFEFTRAPEPARIVQIIGELIGKEEGV